VKVFEYFYRLICKKLVRLAFGTSIVRAQKQNEQGVRHMYMDIPMSSGYMKKKCLHIEVNHGREELHESSCYVQQNGIDANVPIYIIKVYPSDVWHPHLETVIFVPRMEHTS
jgi:hypothetical protein